ncbi:cupin domain-containing protein [Christiangramia forsetii]|uniref:RmlC-like cupin family protein n=2 Tax=Christiangramia forsetii TaxID=411153 RepID=A0M168_CHRFK|nr:cupin domain-containing protein [Christiangramia forsetii]GGG43216.1 cupin [Christiangramia forsetii]CAL66363.1 RmlC-like cupin family protein [Christiangramia forsetii KT0803]
MKTASLTNNLEYNEKHPVINVLLDTHTGKEIRIVFKKGQVMKKHHTPFPIVVEIFEGSIDFGVNGEVYTVNKGDLLALEANVSHDLTALIDSIVRLSLNKADTAKRVEDVAKSSS